MFVYETVIQQQILYIFLSRGRCPATHLRVTILKINDEEVLWEDLTGLI
jgi:hypothetical protein